MKFMKKLLPLLSLLLATNAWGDHKVDVVEVTYCTGELIKSDYKSCTMHYDNGYYKGYWENGKKHGFGLYKWNDGSSYMGNWKEDKITEGVMTYSNGRKWQGTFENGKQSKGEWLRELTPSEKEAVDAIVKKLKAQKQGRQTPGPSISNDDLFVYSLTVKPGEICPMELNGIILSHQELSGNNTVCRY